MVNSSLALNRKVYMDALTVCSGLLVTIHKKRRMYMILFHSYALGSLVQSPNRTPNSSLALYREVYVRCSNSLQWFISNNSPKKKERTYMILFHSYALWSLVQSPNRTANSSLALNREVYMDAVTVCSGLLVTVYRGKKRT